LIKGYGLRKSLAEFPMKNWTKDRLDTLLKKVMNLTLRFNRVFAPELANN